MNDTMETQQYAVKQAQIIVVDDQPANLVLLNGILKEQGYRVRPVTNGTDALHSILKKAPDLILLDILMPGISGFDLCEILKKEDSTRDIPIIFISSMTEIEDKIKGFELGAVDYITKPIQREEVLARVKTHLTLRRLQQRLKEENERFQRMEEVSFEGLLIHQEGRILDINTVIVRIFGSARENVLGRKLLDVIPHEYHKQLTLRLQEKYASPWKLEAFRADGTRVPIEISCRTIAWQGEEARVVAVRDLSEIRGLEQKTQALEAENLSLRASLSDRERLGELVGKSPSMHKVYERLIQAAASPETVMIYGETGSGKELAARSIFQLSEHHTTNFVAVNCGAVPESLFESQFFGYRKGAFSGAHKDTIGFFEQAEGGTLFLDEVGELTLTMQTKLLRVLNDGVYTVLGETKERRADIRILAATNRELREMVKEGALREDFFHRLHVIVVELPPLRRRKEDLPLLIEHFLEQQAAAGTPDPAFPAALLQRFLAYDWPGNVRELFNELRRWKATGEVELSGDASAPDAFHAELPFLQDGLKLKEAQEAFEAFYLKRAIEQHGEHRGRAAKQLGIDRKTLYAKLKKYEER